MTMTPPRKPPYEVAAFTVSAVAVGLVIAVPDTANEQRLAIITAIVGGWLILARMTQRRNDDDG